MKAIAGSEKPHQAIVRQVSNVRDTWLPSLHRLCLRCSHKLEMRKKSAEKR